MLTSNYVAPEVDKFSHLDSESELVFETKAGRVWQSDCLNALVLDFQGRETLLSIQSFLDLKERLQSIDLERMIMRNQAVEIIMPIQSERCYVLCPYEIFKFKSLLEGAYTMLELNSIIWGTVINPSTFSFEY